MLALTTSTQEATAHTLLESTAVPTLMNAPEAPAVTLGLRL
jgi:hypothetical protein